MSIKEKLDALDWAKLRGQIIKYLWLALVTGLILIVLIFMLVSFSRLPDTEELENPQFEISSMIYADDMEEVGRYFTKNREWVTYDELSPYAVDALLATEDIRYFSHSGIDPRGTVRMLAFMGQRGGASTITQQLAKQFFTKGSKNIIRRVWQKLQEWVIAIAFEKRYTKEEIMAMYLNKYDFLYNSSGISAAAKTYFGKDQKDLQIEEAAVLIGMLNNSRLYNPIINPEYAVSRRNLVLSQMYKYGSLSKIDYDSLRVLPLDGSRFKKASHDTGPAPHFRQVLTQWLRQTLDDPRYAKPGGGKYDIYRDGLKIFTTLDLDMQRHAEAAAESHMAKIQERYFQVWDELDPWTYDADSGQKSQRNASLKRRIEESQRYKNLKGRVLTDVLTDISGDIENARFRDVDIKRMLRQRDDQTYLTQQVADEMISRSQRETYIQILESNHWPKLIQAWNTLQEEVKREFSTKVEMKVFAYNDAGEKDAYMSPLDSIRYHRMHMQIGSVAMEPQTGYVKTWLGGVGFKYFKYDHVTSSRQVGSTFKPFIYMTGIMQGWSPCQKVTDQQYTIDRNDRNFNISKDWGPKNSNGTFTGQELTLYEGLKTSTNSTSIWLMKQIGSVQAVIDRVSNMGIPESKIPKYPSICLGTPSLTVLEMTAAYNCFANKGIYTEPVFVKRIEDADGRVIYASSSKQSKAINENYAYVMTDMLKYAASVVSGRLETIFGGKTGTTDDHHDGWFMGLTPNLVTGTWVGGEDTWIRFLSIADGQGGAMARPYFLDFMRRVESDDEIEFDVTAQFPIPDGPIGIETNCAIYDQLRIDNPSYSQQDSTGSDFYENEFDEEY